LERKCIVKFGDPLLLRFFTVSE